MSAAVSLGQPTSPVSSQAAGGNEHHEDNENEDKRWQPVLGLPCELTVDLALPGFKVSDMLRLGPGSVLGSTWRITQDVPLRVNGTLIGWSKFEVVGDKLAVRLTELA